jgi:thioredoxin-related protein
MKARKGLLILLGLLVGGMLGAQSLHWTSFADLNDSLRARRKPLLIFIHADWCKFCKMQEQNTFGDSALVAALQRDFYCLRLNAEEQNEIRFLNRAYRYRSHGAGVGRHELAEFLAMDEGEMSLPTTVLLDWELRVHERMKGFLSAKDIERTIDHLRQK